MQLILKAALCAAVHSTVFATAAGDWERSAEGVLLPAHGEDDWQAGWIWYGKGGECERFFRKAFSCDPSTLRLAAFQWVSDDGAEVFVNGSSLGQVTSWARPKVREDVLPLLKKGTNEISVRAWNRGSSSGFMGELDLVGKDGSVVKVGSGADWEGAESAEGPWGRAREFMRKPQPPYGETPYIDYTGRNRGQAEPDLKPYVPAAGERLVTSIRRANGAMHYFENGVERPFVAYRTPSTDGRIRALRHLAPFDRAGVRLAEVCIGLRDVWPAEGTFDFAALDRKLLGALNFAPHMNLIVFVCVDPPPWYVKAHPADRYVLDSGVIDRMSYASETMRRDVRAALARLVGHVKDGPYYGRIAGFGLDGGDDGQFMQWSGVGYRQMGDYSEPMRRLFGREIPSADRRRGGPDRLFLDPDRDADVIAYNRLYGSVAADFMLDCAKDVKDATDREKIVGVYYGKFYSLAGYLESGELAIRRVLDSPDVDYLIAVEYNQRSSGSPHSISAPTESYRLHGKMFMDEADIRTFLDGQKNWGYAGDEKGTESMIRKMFALSFTRGHAIHWYDLFGGWFDHPEIERMICEVQKIAARHAGDAVGHAQIAVVCDEESLIRSTSAIKRETARTMNHLQNGVLGRIGAPFDLYFADDLVAAPRYRMYVFLNCFAPTPSAQAEIDRIRASGAKCVFVNPKDRVPTAAEYRAMARAAGVHVISAADDVMVYAGRGLLAVHSASAGAKPLAWPEKATFRDAVSGEVVAAGTDSFSLDMAAGGTRILEVEKAPDVDVWHGANLLGLFSWSERREANARFAEHEFRWLSGWGFNFARLPIDYRYLMETNDWTQLKAEGFKKVDEAVACGRKYGVHVQVCLHRAPGYTIASWLKDTTLRLQRDREPQEAFIRLWREFARRYRGVPNRELSFNLVNEPSGFTEEEYIDVFGRTLEAIRAIDPGRFVMLDGNRTASQPVPHFYQVPLTGQAFRGYTPHAISHYGASYIKQQPPVEPTWPLSAEMVTNRLWIYEQPEKTLEKFLPARRAGYPVMIGEFGCYCKVSHKTALDWMESCLKLWQKEGLGWAIWNVTGSFGFVDSKRTDVDYEDFEGHKLDRKMLELLRKYAKHKKGVCGVPGSGAAEPEIPND